MHVYVNIDKRLSKLAKTNLNVVARAQNVFEVAFRRLSGEAHQKARALHGARYRALL